jgi:hypothetical protein
VNDGRMFKTMLYLLLRRKRKTVVKMAMKIMMKPLKRLWERRRERKAQKRIKKVTVIMIMMMMIMMKVNQLVVSMNVLSGFVLWNDPMSEAPPSHCRFC